MRGPHAGAPTLNRAASDVTDAETGYVERTTLPKTSDAGL